MEIIKQSGNGILYSIKVGIKEDVIPQIQHADPGDKNRGSSHDFTI